MAHSLLKQLPHTSLLAHELNYELSVEPPVTLATSAQAVRINGSCCDPSSNSSCTVCPDDPSADIYVLVCFRTGGSDPEGSLNNASYCPLGGREFTPNQLPGEVVVFEPQPEGVELPEEYPVSWSWWGMFRGSQNLTRPVIVTTTKR